MIIVIITILQLRSYIRHYRIEGAGLLLDNMNGYGGIIARNVCVQETIYYQGGLS